MEYNNEGMREETACKLEIYRIISDRYLNHTQLSTIQSKQRLSIILIYVLYKLHAS